MPDDVDATIDALFAGSPEEFVTVRDRLAADLRRSGDRDRAAAVKALRRPTVAAGALNRVAHTEPAVVRGFFDASTALRRLQEAGDDPDALRAAITEQRAARRAVVDAADAVLGARGAGAVGPRDEIAATLDAAALDDALAAAVAAGRLERAGGSASAFSTLTPNPDAPKPSPPGPDARDTRPARGPRKDSATAASADAAARRRQAARDARILAAAGRLDEAQRAVAGAEAAAAAADAQLRAARHAVRGAERAQAAATRALTRARAAEERARASYDRA